MTKLRSSASHFRSNLIFRLLPYGMSLSKLFIGSLWLFMSLFAINSSTAKTHFHKQGLEEAQQDNQLEQIPNAEILVKELKGLQLKINTNAKPLSMQEAIALGIRNNPEILQAFRLIQEYEWQLIAAKRQWYPSLNASSGSQTFAYQWSTNVSDQYALPAKQLQGQRKNATKSQGVVFQPNVSINWNFIDATRQPNINSASESLRQQKFLFDVSSRNLILNIQKEYYAIQSGKQLIDASIEIYHINQKQLDFLEAQASIGMVTILDVEQTRAQLYSQLSDLVAYTQQYIIQTSALAQSLALPKGTLAIPSDSASLQGEWPVSLELTLEKAQKQREEVLAVLAAAEAAKWNGISALRSYLPVFSLVGGGSLSMVNGYQKVPVPEDPRYQYSRSRQWDAAAGIGFTWSIFDGGIQAANAKASKYRSMQLEAQAVQTELQVMKEVRSSYAQLQTSLIAVQSARIAYQSASIAQEAARARFAVGIGEITSVVQAIGYLSQASKQLSMAMLSHNNAIAELYRYSATWPGNSHKELKERLNSIISDSSSKAMTESFPGSQ